MDLDWEKGKRLKLNLVKQSNTHQLATANERLEIIIAVSRITIKTYFSFFFLFIPFIQIQCTLCYIFNEEEHFHKFSNSKASKS